MTREEGAGRSKVTGKGSPGVTGRRVCTSEGRHEQPSATFPWPQPRSSQQAEVRK